MMKRMIAVAATLVLTATAAFAAAESYTVGIGQFAEHGSLDNCRTGFVEGLAEAGLVEGDNLTILYQNAQADMGIAQQIAAQLVITTAAVAKHVANIFAKLDLGPDEGNRRVRAVLAYLNGGPSSAASPG